jgi:apolipoprotein N-acyltransferase
MLLPQASMSDEGAKKAEAEEAADGAADDDAKSADEKKSPKKKPKKKAEDSAPQDWAPHPIVGNWAALGLAALSAVLGPLGHAGFDIWPLAFIAWVPLIIALRGRTPKQALWLGWGFGFATTMVGFHWLIEMLKVFSGFPLPLCILFASILCVQMGGRMALLGWLAARMERRGWHHGLSFLGAFAVSELIYPLLFTWYYGAAMHAVPLMMQTADLGGPILVTMMVLAVNVALAELLQKPLHGTAIDRRTVIAGFGFAAVAALYGFVRMASVDASLESAEKITVGMVQGNMPLKGRGRAVPVHIKRTHELREKGVDLVVWSEAAMARGFNVKTYEKDIQRRVTRHLGVPTIVGGVIYERMKRPNGKGRRARYFNSAFITDDKGAILGRYDKQFLLMFGEYLPFGDDFPILYKWSPNSGSFSKGKIFDSLPFGDHKIAAHICYEDLSPSHINKMVDVGDPDLLVNMTNDAWFGDTIEPWQHLALAKFRSVEQRMYMVRVTNSGVSAIIDPNGRVTVQSGTFTEEALTGEVHFLKNRTIYNKLGDIPWWVITILCFAAAFIRKPKKKK